MIQYNRVVIYLYYGDNDLLRKRAVDELTTAFVAKYGADAVSQINCSDIEPQQLIAEIVNANLFAPERLLLLEDVDRNSAAWALLGDNLGRIADGTSLVVAARSPDKRTRTFKVLKSTASVKEFQPLKGRELSDWLHRELAENKIEYKSAVVDELITVTGGDQWRLATEIAKLRTLDQVVTVELVRDYVEPNLEANAFMILERTLTGRRDLALAELSKLEQSEDPNKFMGLLASQTFALAAAIHGSGQSDLASRLKIHPFQLAKMNDLSRRLGDAAEQKARIKQIISLLAATDVKIKLSRPAEAWSLVGIALAKC